MPSRFALLATALALASTVTGHMAMQHPVALVGADTKDPLLADGSNFPCHGVQLPGSGGQSFQAGSSQKLQFKLDGGFNTAVHGGGSCQISVTYETDPVKIKDPANWRVIKSIEGGCPTNSPLNLDESYTGPQGTYTGAKYCTDPTTNGVDCVNTFDFDIPKDLPSGQATIAWTWFNNVGNREMYMNCGAANIEGGSSDTSFFNSLPQMFVANMASVNSCPTTEDVAVKFPNPGNVLEIKTPEPRGTFAQASTNYPLSTPVGQGCADNAKGSATVAPGSPTSAPSPTAAPSKSGGVFGPGASKTGKSTSFTTQLVTTTAASAPSPTSPPASPSQPSTGSEGVDCQKDGSIVCMPNNMYGLCNYGKAVPQPLAAGMKCANGQIQKRSLHPHGFAHRRAKAAF